MVWKFLLAHVVEALIDLAHVVEALIRVVVQLGETYGVSLPQSLCFFHCPMMQHGPQCGPQLKQTLAEQTLLHGPQQTLLHGPQSQDAVLN